MADQFLARLREPLLDPIPFDLPRVGARPVPGTSAAPIRCGVAFDGHKPCNCTNCGSSNIEHHYHRDILDCLLEGGKQHAGPHIHWRCANCGTEYTTPVLPGTHPD